MPIAAPSPRGAINNPVVNASSCRTVWKYSGIKTIPPKSAAPMKKELTSDAVNAFRTQVIRHWRTALRHRSQRTRINWARMNRIATRWIPQTRTVHPFPQARFAATHPR